jgi:prefoldin subunit 5
MTPKGTPKKFIDRIVETNDRFNALIIKLEDRIERLEEDQSEVAAWIATVEDGESAFDAKLDRVFYRLLSVESHAYRVDDFLNHGIALKGKS